MNVRYVKISMFVCDTLSKPIMVHAFSIAIFTVLKNWGMQKWLLASSNGCGHRCHHFSENGECALRSSRIESCTTITKIVNSKDGFVRSALAKP